MTSPPTNPTKIKRMMDRIFYGVRDVLNDHPIVAAYLLATGFIIGLAIGLTR